MSWPLSPSWLTTLIWLCSTRTGASASLSSEPTVSPDVTFLILCFLPFFPFPCPFPFISPNQDLASDLASALFIST
jgi:hypothetical protein